MSEFKQGDKAVYPVYGVGTVTSVENKEIMGSTLTFYTLKFMDTGMKVMVPKNNAKNVGLRPIISEDEATNVLEILKERDVKVDNQTWNRRYREYMEKIRTGSVTEIAEVLRDLYVLKVDKELSYSEKNMLEKARDLLLKELSLATDKSRLEEGEVGSILGV